MGIVEGNILLFRLGKCVPFSTPDISKDMKEIKRNQPIFVLKLMGKRSLVDSASNLHQYFSSREVMYTTYQLVPIAKAYCAFQKV